MTTRSPIEMLPAVASSSPATMRRVVVFPQPDGPTRTISSPSANLETEVQDGLRAVRKGLAEVL